MGIAVAGIPRPEQRPLPSYLKAAAIEDLADGTEQRHQELLAVLAMNPPHPLAVRDQEVLSARIGCLSRPAQAEENQTIDIRRLAVGKLPEGRQGGRQLGIRQPTVPFALL